MKNVIFILLLIFVQYTSNKNFLRSIPQKVVIVSLSRSQTSAISLLDTKQDDGNNETVKEKTEYEPLSKKLV